MLTPKKTLKTSAKDSEVMVFENGTVLGAVTADCDTKGSYLAVNQDDPSPVEGCETCVNSCCASESLLGAAGAGPLRVATASVINSCEQIVDSGAHESGPPPDTLDSSTCSRESRQSKRLRRKIRRLREKADHLPPQYTAIFLDGGPPGGGLTTAVNQPGIVRDSTHLQLPDPQREGLELPRRRLTAGLFKIPSVPFVIGILALGGVACTLGGIVLGSTGLIEQSTQYLSAALLMIGIGVSLLVISGAVWKLTVADEPPGCPCCRHLETCRNCNSVFCNNRFLAGSFIYPEFQHRTPPPSYLTSLNEFTVGLLLRDAANLPRCSAQTATPPPSYRSYSISSLSASGLVRHSLDSHLQEGTIDCSMTSDKEPTYIEVE